MKKIVLLMLILGLQTVALAAPPTAEPDLPQQDPSILRFVGRALPWHPMSTFEILVDEKKMTPSGSLRLIQVERKGGAAALRGRTTLLFDESANRMWIGSVGGLPQDRVGESVEDMKAFVSTFLPDLVMKNMRVRSELSWDVPMDGAAALVPFNLLIQTGYGSFERPGAMSADGAYVVLGAAYPFDEDPVAFRRDLFADSGLIMWDHEPGDEPIRIVEFSDFECPACRAKWPLIKAQVDRYPAKVLHGMVNFPLPEIHPWAFRAASAGWCVAKTKTSLLPQFKQTFYDLQQDMELSLVTPTALDFVAGNGLDEAAFRACYLKPPSLDGVHAQMTFGNRLGINSTPTYFINGWEIQAPDAYLLNELFSRLLSGEEP